MCHGKQSKLQCGNMFNGSAKEHRELVEWCAIGHSKLQFGVGVVQ